MTFSSSPVCRGEDFLRPPWPRCLMCGQSSAKLVVEGCTREALRCRCIRKHAVSWQQKAGVTTVLLSKQLVPFKLIAVAWHD